MEQNDQQQYVKAQPEVLPEPTYAPFLLAASVTLFGWGFISTWIFCIAGLAGICISIYLWIKALLNE